MINNKQYCRSLDVLCRFCAVVLHFFSAFRDRCTDSCASLLQWKDIFRDTSDNKILFAVAPWQGIPQLLLKSLSWARAADTKCVPNLLIAALIVLFNEAICWQEAVLMHQIGKVTSDGLIKQKEHKGKTWWFKRQEGEQSVWRDGYSWWCRTTKIYYTNCKGLIITSQSVLWPPRVHGDQHILLSAFACCF